MNKLIKRYVCQECGAQHPRWSGRCDSCNSWNTIIEEIQRSLSLAKQTRVHLYEQPSKLRSLYQLPSKQLNVPLLLWRNLIEF